MRRNHTQNAAALPALLDMIRCAQVVVVFWALYSWIQTGMALLAQQALLGLYIPVHFVLFTFIEYLSPDLHFICSMYPCLGIFWGNSNKRMI